MGIIKDTAKVTAALVTVGFPKGEGSGIPGAFLSRGTEEEPSGSQSLRTTHSLNLSLLLLYISALQLLQNAFGRVWISCHYCVL